MPKRESSTANRASPGDLCMDSWSFPMSTTRLRPSSSAAASSSGHGWPLPGCHARPSAAATSTYGYTPEIESGPMPRTNDSWQTYPTYHLHEMHQSQRVLHTQVFKQVEVGQGLNTQRQLTVTEIDTEGTKRLRRAELFFHGIVGHCEGQVGCSNKWMERSVTLGHLLAQILQH